ncbi:MAG: hypothetical protein AB7T31_01470 [Gemmatimonadales bacterium]
MEWEIVAPMVMFVVLILTVGGVLILRPISKRIGDLLELYARDRQAGLQSEVVQMRELMETVNARMQLLEERQDFTERLLSAEKPETASRRELPPTR